MGLSWNVEDVVNQEEVCWLVAKQDDPSRFVEAGKSYLNPLTEVLIFASLATGIGRITEANADEVYARVAYIERMEGPMLYRAEGWPHESRNIRPEEIRAHIGLTTNASFTDEPRAKWLKRVAVRDLDELKAHYGRALTRLDKEAAEAASVAS